MTKSPDAVDKHVGARIRMRRTSIGLSQEKLAGALGVTFQQVQKYEKGTNRVSASRLQQVARVLGVTIGYFYEDMPGAGQGDAPPGFGEADGASYAADVTWTPQGLQLMRAFARIEDAKLRRNVIALVEALADKGGEKGAE